jgi:hypothetical protein
MSPVKRIPEGMIEVVVRVQRTHDGHLRHFSQRLHLEGCAICGHESFNQKCRIFSDQEAAIAHGGKALGGVRNRGIRASTDLAHRGKPGVDHGR